MCPCASMHCGFVFLSVLVHESVLSAAVSVCICLFVCLCMYGCVCVLLIRVTISGCQDLTNPRPRPPRPPVKKQGLSLPSSLT